MQIHNIQELIDHNLVAPDNINIDKQNSTNVYQLYVVNIFLDEKTNKYKNTKPIKCIVKYGAPCISNLDGYCLLTLGENIWTENYRYIWIDKIDEVLINGEYKDRGSLVYVHKFPYLKLFTTYKEAYECIDEYKKQNNLTKYQEKLRRINNDIAILLNEKKRLETLINDISHESNN